MNFLIVEDNDNMRRMIKSLVSEFAGETYECCDGVEALATYAEHLPDWVLMDIRMSEVDGISATRRLKAAFPDANIIIVTAYNDAELRRSAREAGACEYVMKEDLLDLRRILREHTEAILAATAVQEA
ncbi:MAG TPA: response regulator transcription factor [Pyrinomonadaceae bacterium]|jgi:CheY-like chemotaxis protein